MAIDPQQLSALATEYSRQGYAVIRRFVEPARAAIWEAKYRSLSEKKVHVGRDYHVVWSEQTFPDPSLALDGLAHTDWFTTLVCSITGMESIDCSRTQAWINRYRPGDHVPVHCDQTGDTQFLLCLQSLIEPETGGDLLICEQLVPLRTGDAVLFFARGIPHATVPIRSTKVSASGFSRVTCVIRLFAHNDCQEVEQ